MSINNTHRLRLDVRGAACRGGVVEQDLDAAHVWLEARRLHRKQGVVRDLAVAAAAVAVGTAAAAVTGMAVRPADVDLALRRVHYKHGVVRDVGVAAAASWRTAAAVVPAVAAVAIGSAAGAGMAVAPADVDFAVRRLHRIHRVSRDVAIAPAAVTAAASLPAAVLAVPVSAGMTGPATGRCAAGAAAERGLGLCRQTFASCVYCCLVLSDVLASWRCADVQCCCERVARRMLARTWLTCRQLRCGRVLDPK